MSTTAHAEMGAEIARALSEGGPVYIPNMTAEETELAHELLEFAIAEAEGRCPLPVLSEKAKALRDRFRPQLMEFTYSPPTPPLAD